MAASTSPASVLISRDTVGSDATCPEQVRLGPGHRDVGQTVASQRDRGREVEQHLAGSCTARSDCHDLSAVDNARSSPLSRIVCRNNTPPAEETSESRAGSRTTEEDELRLRGAYLLENSGPRQSRVSQARQALPCVTRRHQHPRSEISRLDLAQITDLDDVVVVALERFGRLDAIINTAAVYQPSGATGLDLDGWARTMEPNLRGPMLVASAAARHFVGQHAGRIVHVASITASVSRVGYTLYEASKAGLVAATRSMAVELAPHGVLVNAVAPGWVRTPMTEAFLADCTREAIAELIPVGRVGEAEEIAEVACWLTVDSPGFLAGQTIVVDGGQTARAGHL